MTCMSESFDWKLSDAFDIPRDIKPKNRSEFLFTQTSGSILPGRSITFSFSFKSDIAGCFTQRWILRVTPKAAAGFDRFWDFHITSLSRSIMLIKDGEKKRRLLGKLNEIIRLNMTPSSFGSLSFSIAYVQLSTMLESLPDAFAHEAAIAGVELPPFVAPRAAEANDDEEAENGRRKHKGKREARKPAAKKPMKGSKEEEAQRLLASQQSQRSIASVEIAPELRMSMLAAVKDLLKQRVQTFEQLAEESRGVAAQPTRVNEVNRLDTNLDAEVEDDL